MKRLMLTMAGYLLTILFINAQTILTSTITLRYPSNQYLERDEITFVSTSAQSTIEGYYQIEKNNWRSGDLFQLIIENSQADVYAYFISIDELGNIRHYASSTGQTGYSSTRIGNKIALPGVHNGFVLHSEQLIEGVVLLSDTPLEDVNQKLLEFKYREGSLSDKITAIWGEQIVEGSLLTYAEDQMMAQTTGKGIVPIYLQINTRKPAPLLQSQLHVLSIGPEFSSLQFTEKDARDVANAFKGWEGTHYASINTKVLTGEKATADEIRLALSEFRAECLAKGKPDDKIIAFFSTHGLMIDGEMYLQGSDFDQLRPRETAVSYTEVYRALSGFPGEKIIFMDAAAAPAVADYAPRPFTADEVIVPIATERCYPIFSNRANELSYEDTRWENGAFTEALLEILNEAYNDQHKPRQLTMSEMLTRLTKRTAQLVKSALNKEQNPVITRPVFLDFDWLGI